MIDTWHASIRIWRTAEVSGSCNIAADTDPQQYTVDYNAAVCTICFARIVVVET